MDVLEECYCMLFHWVFILCNLVLIINREALFALVVWMGVWSHLSPNWMISWFVKSWLSYYVFSPSNGKWFVYLNWICTYKFEKLGTFHDYIKIWNTFKPGGGTGGVRANPQYRIDFEFTDSIFLIYVTSSCISGEDASFLTIIIMIEKEQSC